MVPVVVPLEALLSPVESSTQASGCRVVVEPLLLAHAPAGEAVVSLSVSAAEGLDLHTCLFVESSLLAS